MKSILFFVLIILSMNLSAYEVPSYFLGRWTATPVHNRKKGGKIVAKSKVFARFAKINQHVFKVGTITFFQTKTKDDQLDKKFFNKMKNSHGDSSKWKITKKGRSTIIEGPWTGGNRYIRYYITEHSDSVSISTATMRFGYQDSVDPESLLIQEQMAIEAKDPQKYSFFNHISPIATAYAQTVPSWLLPTGGAGAPGSTMPGGLTTLNTTMTNLNTNMDNIGTQLGATNVQLGNSNAQWGSTNVQLAQANANWAQTNTQLQVSNQQAASANQNWAATNAQFAKANATGELMAAEYQRTNDIAEKMMDPKHLFTLAASTAAGAVFGAALANLVIDGVVAGAKAIWGLITQSSAKKERWEKFQEARKQWDEVNETVRNLEALLDSFLNSQEFMTKMRNALSDEDKNKLSRENLVSHLSITKRRLDKRKKKLEDAFKKTQNPQCEEYLAVELEEVEKLLFSSNGVKEYLEKQTFVEFNDKMFCDDIQSIMRKLGEAEAELQKYRIEILNGRNQWEEKNDNRVDDLVGAVDRLNNKRTAKKFKDERIDNAEDLYETEKNTLQKRENRYVDTCKVKAPNWNKVRKSLGKTGMANMRKRNKIIKACRKEYQKIYGKRDSVRLADAKKRLKKKKAIAKRDHERTLSRPIEVDTSVEDRRLLSYYKWFSDIEEQQHCYTHKEESKCVKAGKVKFMGPFYVLDRAQVKMKDVCGTDLYDY